MKELDRATEAPSTLVSYNPATGEALGSVPLAGPSEVAEVVARARRAAEGWRALGYAGRREALLRWRDAFVAARDEVSELVTLESGKPRADAATEIFGSCEFLAYYAQHAERMLEDEPIRQPNPIAANRETFLTYEPLGVIGVISPWNYPLLLTMAEAAGALAAGNTVVVKPSELTPLVGLKMAELWARAGLPADVFAVVTGDGTTGAALTDARVDRVCFTGSVATGRKVAKAALDRLAPVTLELGGKDPALVCEDADLDFTAQGLVWAAFTNAGQTCASVERVYAPTRVLEPLTERIVARVKALKVGDGMDPDTEVGPLINEAQLERVHQQVQAAIAQGATLLTGGHRLDRPGTFYAPTVLANVTHDMAIMREETFGPVLPIMAAESEEALVRLANDSTFGLSATVWTRDLARGKRLARQVRAGTVWVNTGLSSYANPLTPRGGFNESGIGKIGGRLGLLEMVHAKVVDVSDHGPAKDWWFPAWPGAYDYLTAGIDLLHGNSLGRKLEGVLRFLRTRR